MCCFRSFEGLFGVDLHAKSARFAACKKVMSFVFSHFLASFPLFFIFCRGRLSPLAGTNRLADAQRRVAAPAYDKLSPTRPQG
jgi:hypothetical protein